MKFKLDLHVHTTNSRDAHTAPQLLEALCMKAGIDGLAVTDHNVLSTFTSDKVLMIPGIEISSRDGHVIGLGVSELIERGLSADETIRKIQNDGGVCIIPHPYDLLRSSVRPERLTAKPDAIEVVNSASVFHSITWRKARKFSNDKHLPSTGGSDSHIPRTVGRAFTIVDSPSKDVSSVLNAIREGATLPAGKPVRFYERLTKIMG